MGRQWLRAQVWGRPRARSGTENRELPTSHSVREDARVGATPFDLYEHGLREELGEDGAGVAELRGKIVWVDDSRKALGFSEYHPVDNLGRDGYRSQANRRVENLFFDEGEEPNMALAQEAPEQSELYLPGVYERRHLGARKSGKATGPIWLRFNLSLAEAAASGDMVRLYSDSANYDETQPLANAAAGAGASTELEFQFAPKGDLYTLDVLSLNGQLYTVFEHVPYSLLNDDSLPA